ncbi:hypothetical protein [Pelistega europaea]|uniref:Phospholipase/carboxylesterase/thioesterase domain-containing protein n=1 Tax=Pelistega europaea TaxID=106147 RepID=A0A7Y4LB87_9BURK|nr:hypothetical protein [Pelistega europaea]NOL50327.1 hypothetical protein [Pelistega europaea]
MSIFTIERALQPQGGNIAQLFVIFVDVVDENKINLFCQQIAKTFPAAAMVVAIPSDALAFSEHLRAEHKLSDEEFKTFVQSHHKDIQGFIKAFQAHLHIDAAATALVGVGQMGALVLELTKLANPLAGRVISFGSRFAELPTEALSLEQTIHLLHSRQDSLVDFSHTVQAQEKIAQFEGDATIDVAHVATSSFDETLIQQMMQRLLTCVPLRYWKEAQSGAPTQTLDSRLPNDEDAVH